MFTKCLFQLLKCVIGMILYKVFAHSEILSFKMKPNILMISTSTISPLGSYCLFENSDVNIKINILHVCWILKFLLWQFINWSRSNCNQWLQWWHEYPWIRCWPSIKSNKWIRWWSSRWVSIKWSCSKQSSIRWTSKWFSTWLWMWINPFWLSK
jgi:hypothetical protein